MSEKAAKKHEKHMKEYGVETFEQYVQIARDLLNAPLSDDIDEFINNADALYRYQKSTNDFVIGLDGKIITLFKPKDGEEYWKGEKEREQT